MPRRLTGISLISSRGSTFYFSAGSSNDWTSPQNGNLWLDLAKTLFDPCPTGWRVARGGGGAETWGSFFTFSHAIKNGDWVLRNGQKGAEWHTPAVIGGKAWYPTSGLREASLGVQSDLSIRGLFWSAWVNRYFNVSYQAEVLLNGAGVAYGLSVRCIRE